MFILHIYTYIKYINTYVICIIFRKYPSISILVSRVVTCNFPD